MKNPKIAVRLLLCAVIVEGPVTAGALLVAYRKPQVVYKHDGIKQCEVVAAGDPGNVIISNLAADYIDFNASHMKSEAGNRFGTLPPKTHPMKRKSHKPLCFNCPIHLSACQGGLD